MISNPRSLPSALATAAALGLTVTASVHAAETRAQQFAEENQVIVAPPGNLSDAGREFITRAADYHRRQVHAAARIRTQIDASQVDTGAARDYADQLMQDQERAYDKLRQVAAMHGIDLAPLNSASDARASARAGEADESKATAAAASDSGNAASVIEQIIDDQESTLNRFETLDEQIQSSNVKAYLESLMPVVAEHLKIARRLELERAMAAGELSLQERGRYLALAGGCMACHTRDGGDPFAGGVSLETPYGGYLYSANITPSAEGIGAFTDEDFLTALHKGIAPNGKPYYPAFPYPSFTYVRDEDLLAIKAYLDRVKPSDYVPPEPELPWPLGIRDGLYAWQELYFEPRRFEPDSNKSEQWNRGAYLVKGLGHCGTCHTPRNMAGAKKDEQALSGATRLGWYAPSLRAKQDEGIGRYSIDALVNLMQSGQAASGGDRGAPRATALGPMAEVVHDSLSYMTTDDLRAMSVYMKDLPPVETESDAPAQGHAMDQSLYALGKSVYEAWCAACHRDSGQGQPPYVPSLRDNPILNQPNANNIVLSILTGAPVASSQAFSPYVRMPGYADSLDDRSIAAVAGYLRARWGDDATGGVPLSLPARLRTEIEKAPQ